MKRVLAIVLCVMMVGSVFALALSANAAEEDPNAPVGAASDVSGEGAAADPTFTDIDDVDGTDFVEPTYDDGTQVVETTDETTVETTVETTISTEPTTVVTEATEPAPSQATKDEQIATATDKKASPKTGENYWLWIALGVFAVALIAVIITFVVKKKAK